MIVLYTMMNNQKSFDVTITQRSRWVKGYFDARRNYIHKIRKSISKKIKIMLQK